MKSLAPLLLMASIAFAAEPKELDKLQGVWKVTEMSLLGMTKEAPVAKEGDIRNVLVVVGDAFVFRSFAGTIKLDGQNLDLIVSEGQSKGTTMQCLYAVEGGKLRLAMSGITFGKQQKRPTSLKTDSMTPFVVYTLEREATTKEQAAEKLKGMTKQVVDSLPSGTWQGRGMTQVERETQTMLKQILDKLEKIEKRLDDVEKRLPEKK